MSTPTPSVPPSRYDVLIAGGGLAGLTLALHLRQQVPSLSIAVLERRTLPCPISAHKVGESTVEVSQTEQLQVQQVLMVAKAMVRAEQEELLRLRDEEGLPDAVVRSIMTKLDLRAQTLAAGRL